MDGRHKLIRWLGPLCEAAPESSPDRIAIRHISVNDRTSDVGAITLPAELEPDSLAQLAETLEMAVQSDADGLGGLQRYVLLMLKGDVQISRLPLRVAGGDLNEDGEPLDSEPATSKGLLAQLMRHNEVTTRSLSMYVGHALAAMQRTIDQQQAIIDSAGEQRLDFFAVTEGLLSEKHNRDLATAEMELKLAQKSQVWEKAMQYLPLLLARVLPAGSVDKAGEPNSFALLLRSFFETFTEEQIQALQGVLSPPQMMAVFDLMDKVKEQTEKKADGKSDEPDDKTNGATATSQATNGAAKHHAGPGSGDKAKGQAS